MTPGPPTTVTERRWAVDVRRAGPDGALVALSGAWRNEDRLPDGTQALRALESRSPVRRLAFDTSGITAWDSGLVTFVLKVLGESKARGITADRAGLPEGVQRLLRLVEAVPEKQTGRGGVPPPWPARIGTRAVALWSAATLGLGWPVRPAITMAVMMQPISRVIAIATRFATKTEAPNCWSWTAQRVVAKVDAQTDPLLDSIRSTSDTARATIEQAQVTLGGVDRTLDQESPNHRTSIVEYPGDRRLQAIRCSIHHRALSDVMDPVANANAAAAVSTFA